MRTILVLVAVLLVLLLVGWLTVSDTPERSTINVEKQKIQQDTTEMVEQGNELLDKAREAVTPETTTSDVAPAPSAAPPESTSGTPSGSGETSTSEKSAPEATSTKTE